MSKGNQNEAKQNTTKTKFISHNLEIPFINELGIDPIAIDIGYDATKVYGLNGKLLFPSLAISRGHERNLALNAIATNENYIFYKDIDRNEIFFVGDLTRDTIDKDDTYNNTALYGKARILTREYKVLLRVGIALGLIKNLDDIKKPGYKISSNNIKVITGLPESWMEDKDKLIKVFTGTHRFEIKMGSSDWIPVSFDINIGSGQENILVMSQPLGTVYSLATNVYGDVVNASLLLTNNLVVFDGGFRTNDLYSSKRGVKAHSGSMTENAMLEVYKATCAEIAEATSNQRILKTYQLDYYVDMGYEIPYTLNNTKQKLNFKQMLDKDIEIYATDVFEKLNVMYDEFQDTDYLVCTGGTGKAFYPYLEKLVPTDVILAEKTESDNKAENFTTVFSNVVGFFSYLIGALKQEYKANSKGKSQKNAEVAVSASENK